MLLYVRFKQKPCETLFQLAFLPSPSLMLPGTSLPDVIKYFKVFHFIWYIHYFIGRRIPLPSFFFNNEHNKQKLFPFCRADLFTKLTLHV